MTTDTRMDERLLPCPFCGSAAQDTVYLITNSGPHIYCDNCGTHGPIMVSEETAIAAWNRRTQAEGAVEGCGCVYCDLGLNPDVEVEGVKFHHAPRRGNVLCERKREPAPMDAYVPQHAQSGVVEAAIALRDDMITRAKFEGPNEPVACGNGVWSPKWGPKPGEHGCKVPAELLERAA